MFRIKARGIQFMDGTYRFEPIASAYRSSEGRHNSSVSACRALVDEGHRKPVVDTTGRGCVGLPGLKRPVHGWHLSNPYRTIEP